MFLYMNPAVHSKAESDLNATILANQTAIYSKLFVLPYHFVEYSNIPFIHNIYTYK